MEGLDFSWFDLSKYEKVESFDLKDWHHQLNERQSLKVLIEHEPERMAHFIKESIMTIKKETFFQCDRWDGLYLSVRDTVYDDLLFASYNAPFQNSLCSPKNEFLVENAHKFIIDTSNMGIQRLIAMLTISLGASDEQLKEDFSEWLKQQRKNEMSSAKKKMFTTIDLQRWVKLKVLSYIDLILISSYEGKTLTQNMLGRVLFPDDYDIDVTERIRQSVKPLADSLLDIHTLEAIFSQSLAR